MIDIEISMNVWVCTVLCVCMYIYTIYMYTHTHSHTHIHVSMLNPLKGPRTNDTPVAMSTTSVQIMVSKYHSPIQKTRAT